MLDFFDCNCKYGYFSIPVFKAAKTPAELIEEMEYCGIKRAIVSSTEMIFHSPLEGNPALLDEIKHYPQLIPTRVILPTQTGEQTENLIFFKELKKQSIKILMALPNENHYFLDKETFGNLFNELSERKIPLLIKAPLVQIRDILREYPELIIIAISQGPHPLDRYLRPLIENYSNFFFDISTYLSEYGIEDLCGKYGPQRLLFGTGYPANYMGSAVLRLTQAGISQEYKEAIASKNLDRILSKVLL
ncbi:MAG: amidohydrolase [Actinobacteria bacterium]|nr:amidohydrolase [Actinomycetota bacterium]